MTEKTCATCKWCVNPGEWAKCLAPENNKLPELGFNLVPTRTYCEGHREDGWLASLRNGTCGRRGRWWQPKEAHAAITNQES